MEDQDRGKVPASAPLLISPPQPLLHQSQKTAARALDSSPATADAAASLPALAACMAISSAIAIGFFDVVLNDLI